MFDVRKEADAAEVIIRGYAVRMCEQGVQVLNLNDGKGAAIFKRDGMLIETNMDDIEADIAREYMLSALKYMEDRQYA